MIMKLQNEPLTRYSPSVISMQSDQESCFGSTHDLRFITGGGASGALNSPDNDEVNDRMHRKWAL